MAKNPLSSRPSKSRKAANVEVEAWIDALLTQKEQEAAMISPEFQDMVAQARQFIARGGKRMRPQLVTRTYQAFGGSNTEAIARVAASQELFHAFALVHDDIIDRDAIRWGGPNIAGHYLANFLSRMEPANAEHYSSAWALLAGNLYLDLAFESLTLSGFTPGRILKAQKLMQQTLFKMIGGELTDVAVSLPGNPEGGQTVDFNRMYEAKTSVYSFCTPLRLGAMFAGAGSTLDKQLNEFGYHLGIAFQIRDDLLGVFGDEAKLGKSNLSDIREGKRTLLMFFGLEMASPPQKAKLTAILGKADADKADLATVQTVLRRCGALQKTESLLQSHAGQARDVLLRADFPMKLNTFLADLLSRSAYRSK